VKRGTWKDWHGRELADIGAAKAFFRKAIKSQGSTPQTITLNGYAASHRAGPRPEIGCPDPADGPPKRW
jgi:hypothetical protein